MKIDRKTGRQTDKEGQGRVGSSFSGLGKNNCHLDAGYVTQPHATHTFMN